MIRCVNCNAQLRVSGILTPRQLEVLGLASQGLMNKEIALRLGISTDTVNNHMVHIKDSLGCVTRLEAVVKFLEEKWGVKEEK